MQRVNFDGNANQSKMLTKSWGIDSTVITRCLEMLFSIIILLLAWYFQRKIPYDWQNVGTTFGILLMPSTVKRALTMVKILFSISTPVKKNSEWGFIVQEKFKLSRRLLGNNFDNQWWDVENWWDNDNTCVKNFKFLFVNFVILIISIYIGQMTKSQIGIAYYDEKVERYLDANFYVNDRFPSGSHSLEYVSKIIFDVGCRDGYLYQNESLIKSNNSLLDGTPLRVWLPGLWNITQITKSTIDTVVEIQSISVDVTCTVSQINPCWNDTYDVAVGDDPDISQLYSVSVKQINNGSLVTCLRKNQLNSDGMRYGLRCIYNPYITTLIVSLDNHGFGNVLKDYNDMSTIGNLERVKIPKFNLLTWAIMMSNGAEESIEEFNNYNKEKILALAAAFYTRPYRSFTPTNVLYTIERHHHLELSKYTLYNTVVIILGTLLLIFGMVMQRRTTFVYTVANWTNFVIAHIDEFKAANSFYGIRFDNHSLERGCIGSSIFDNLEIGMGAHALHLTEENDPLIPITTVPFILRNQVIRDSIYENPEDSNHNYVVYDQSVYFSASETSIEDVEH